MGGRNAVNSVTSNEADKTCSPSSGVNFLIPAASFLNDGSRG